MGVNDLETFMKTKIPNGVKNVDIMLEIMKFNRENFGKRPILVFDVMSIVGYLCKNRIEVLCGGCHDSYHFHLTKFFAKLRLHCDLQFFMDGFVQMEAKFLTWQKRQNKKYKDSMAIIKDVYQGKSLNEIVRTNNYMHVNTMVNVIEDVAMLFGTLKYVVYSECDQEVAQFAAQQSRVLAVFSDDSDFLIFGGRWRYFSMKCFNSSTFCTKEYDRAALRSALNLSDFQMSIFATCLGNDIICHTSLKSFHRRFGDKFRGVADFIRKITAGLKTHSEIIESLVVAIFGGNNDYYKNLISASISSYNIHYQTYNFEGPFDYLLSLDNLLFSRNVLSNAPFNFSLIFFDLQKHLLSYFDISIAMFQRQAGVVFAQAGMDPHPLRVYSKMSHTQSYDMYNVDPIIPPFEVLSMKDVHSTDAAFDDHRFKLIAWTICYEKLSDFNLRLIPPGYMIDILTLTYMVQSSIITSKEADLILFSIKRAELGESIRNPPNKLDPRAFHIAFLYTRMFSNVARSIEISGMKKIYGKHLNFNGIDFHNLYNKFKDKDFDSNTYLGNIKLNNN